MRHRSEREKLREMKKFEYSIFKKDACERCNEKGAENLVERDEDGYLIRKKRHWMQRNLTVHHKDRNIENNSPENLETLCRKCHTEEHKNDIT